jgi:hypothetical protein
MATVTINYDGRNSLVKQILKSAILAGATLVASKSQSPLDEALEDVRLGRVTTICSPKTAKRK